MNPVHFLLCLPSSSSGTTVVMWSGLALLVALTSPIGAYVLQPIPPLTSGAFDLNKPALHRRQPATLFHDYDSYRQTIAIDTTFSLQKRAKVSLKILPIGDSITQGYRSSDSNGYRLDLFNDLENGGYQITFVGMALPLSICDVILLMILHCR